MTMQTGAGGTSLAVASYVKNLMIKKQVKGLFASGGITSYFVNMAKEEKRISAQMLMFGRSLYYD